jgi:hypothetical protein
MLYYLLQKMPLKDCFNLIKSKRTQYTKPNSGFSRQLLKLEKELHGNNTMTLYDILK